MNLLHTYFVTLLQWILLVSGSYQVIQIKCQLFYLNKESKTNTKHFFMTQNNQSQNITGYFVSINMYRAVVMLQNYAGVYV